MKSKDQFKELSLKSVSELHRLLAEKREQQRDLKFKASQNQLKEVRKMRETRKAIAKILTLLKNKSKK